MLAIVAPFAGIRQFVRHCLCGAWLVTRYSAPRMTLSNMPRLRITSFGICHAAAELPDSQSRRARRPRNERSSPLPS